LNTPVRLEVKIEKKGGGLQKKKGKGGVGIRRRFGGKGWGTKKRGKVGISTLMGEKRKKKKGKKRPAADRKKGKSEKTGGEGFSPSIDGRGGPNLATVEGKGANVDFPRRKKKKKSDHQIRFDDRRERGEGQSVEEKKKRPMEDPRVQSEKGEKRNNNFG